MNEEEREELLQLYRDHDKLRTHNQLLFNVVKQQKKEISKLKRELKKK